MHLRVDLRDLEGGRVGEVVSSLKEEIYSDIQEDE